MTTARAIITSALTTRLNRLSPGESLDADLAAACLSALNDIADECSGSATVLWREALHSATITGTTGTLGTDWANIDPGQQILGATHSTNYTTIQPLTMAQYHHGVTDKTTSGGNPQFYAHDGQATVYFSPGCNGDLITLRVREPVSEFADLDTSYTVPPGYRAGLADMLAERMAPSIVGSVPAEVLRFARSARRRLAAQATSPAIVAGGGAVGNILTGW